MSLVGEVDISLDLLQRVPLDLSTPFDWVSQNYDTEWADGADDDEADIHYHERRKLAAASSYTYILDDGSLSDQFANALTFAYLKMLLFYNRSATVTLKIGAPSTYLWYLDLMASGAGYAFRSVPPYGKLLIATPLNASDIAGFQQRFQVYNPHASTPVYYDVYLVGVSA